MPYAARQYGAPPTISHGTNQAIGARPFDLEGTVDRLLRAPAAEHIVPPLWDRRAAEWIAVVLEEVFQPKVHAWN